MDDQYRVPEDFRYFDKFVEDLRYLARLLLSILPQSYHKSLMIMFFIARGDACLHGIYLLCKDNSFSNARILHRTLIDLIVHMKHVLVDNDLVEEFRDYTIKEKSRVADYMLMTAKDRGEVDAETEQYAKKFQKMYREVLRERGKPVWIRPKAETSMRECTGTDGTFHPAQ